MLVHPASRFMSESVKNVLGCNSSMCVLMLTRQNKCIQPSMTFEILFRGLCNCIKYNVSRYRL